MPTQSLSDKIASAKTALAELEAWTLQQTGQEPAVTDDRSTTRSALVTQTAPPHPPQQAVRPTRVKRASRPVTARGPAYYAKSHTARHTLQSGDAAPPQIDAPRR